MALLLLEVPPSPLSPTDSDEQVEPALLLLSPPLLESSDVCGAVAMRRRPPLRLRQPQNGGGGGANGGPSDPKGTLEKQGKIEVIQTVHYCLLA